MPATGLHSILVKKENAHDDAIYCCAWTKTNTTGDSKAKLTDFIVTGALDGLIKVWKLDENNKLELLHTLSGHTLAVVSVAVSPDGHTLASTAMDCTLVIWDMLSGQKVHEIPSGPMDVWKVAFSPEGTQVVSGSQTGKLIVYSLETKAEERVLDTRGKFALGVAWSPDGKYIASGASDGTVFIFDVAQGKLLHSIEAHTQPVRCVSFTPNSKRVVSASNDGSVKIYDAASASLQGKIELGCWTLGSCVSPDGVRLATCAGDGSVLLSLLTDPITTLHTFREHTDTVWGIQFNAEGNKLLSVSKDKCINIYECPIVPLPKNPNVKTEILIK